MLDYDTLAIRMADTALAARMAAAAKNELAATKTAGWFANRAASMCDNPSVEYARRSTAERQERNARLRTAIRAELAQGWRTHFQVTDALPPEVRTRAKTVADNIRAMLGDGEIERRRESHSQPYEYRMVQA